MQRNGSMPACASCKHQRKKCSANCLLAPFFPASKNREFQAVHKLFGVSNVTKILKSLKEEDRRRASETLAWEAFCRERDPVLGPYGEYRKVYEELKLYKSQYGPIQVQAQQGSMTCKPAPNLVGWNNNNGILSNNQNNLYFQNKEGGSIADSTSFGYYSDHLVQGLERKRIERDHLGSVIILPQQNPMHNHQYYLSG